MLAIRDPKIEKRLERLAQISGRTKTYHVNQALLDYLGDQEDGHLALQRLQQIKRGGKTYSAQEVKRALLRTGSTDSTLSSTPEGSQTLAGG